MMLMLHLCKFVKCVMMTEIETIEGGQKDVFWLEGTTFIKNKLSKFVMVEYILILRQVNGFLTH